MPATKGTITLRGALFIGIGSMVGTVWRAVSKRRPAPSTPEGVE